MAKRHDEALNIQHGACNLSGVAHTLISAIGEAKQEGIAPKDDAAVRLIIHQMHHIARIGRHQFDLELEANALLEAISIARQDGENPEDNGPVKQVLHRLCLSSNVEALNGTSDEYTCCTTVCKENSPMYQAKITRFNTIAEMFPAANAYPDAQCIMFVHPLDEIYGAHIEIYTEGAISIKVKALRKEEGAYVPTGFGLCGEVRTTLKSYVRGIQENLSETVGDAGYAVATDDLGLF